MSNRDSPFRRAYVRPIIQIIDVESHVADCPHCRASYCSTARAIANLGRAELYSASVRSMGAAREMGRA